MLLQPTELEVELEATLPNLNKLATIGLLLPMSTVDCKQGFSALTRIKTDLQNRLSSKAVNNLMMIAVLEGQVQMNSNMIRLVILGLLGEIVELMSVYDC